MSSFLQDLQVNLSSIDWTVIVTGLIGIGTTIVTGVIGVWMAIIATIGLSTWKHQIRAHKHTDFLDELTDTVHAFIVSMSAPVEILRYIKIKIDCPSQVHDKSGGQKNSGAINFIEKYGKVEREHIQKYLELAKPHLIKMNSLVAKGQIFGIDNYCKCQNACQMLIRSYDQIESFSYIIGESNLYWPNPEVQETLEKVLKVNSEDIKENLIEQNKIYLIFAKQAYAKTLKI